MGSIADIIVSPLRKISVVGGDVLRVMKKGDGGFADFGEAYFSVVHPGAIKAWKRHSVMTLNLVVPIGMVKFIFIDESDSVREEWIGEDRYKRLTVPPGIWFGFMGMSNANSVVLNIANIQHDESEVQRKAVFEYAVDWSGKK